MSRQPSVPARQPAALLRGLLFALLGLCALGRPASASTAGGNTLNVPAQYATIQAAINASVSGDTVLLADGTYSGPGDVDLDFLGKNITVTSQDGAAKTVIDCGGFSSFDGSGDHRGFILQSGETGAVISGLTIQNGYEGGNGSGDGNGGGIEVGGATVTVQNCVLQYDGAAYEGGGLFNDGGTTTLTDDTFSGDAADGRGGGLSNNYGMVTLTNDTLTGDTAGYSGGGLSNGGTATLTGCALTGDTAPSSEEYGGGGGLYNVGTLTLTGCALTDDTCYFSNGAGGGLKNYGTATLTYDTISGDTAYHGGGIDNSGTLTLTNDILYGNSAQSGGEVYNDQRNGSASGATATHCDIAGGLPPGTTDNGGNKDADPKFVSPPADLHLQPGSPCLGKGTPDGAPTTTLDGYPRPTPPSIGAFEREPQTVNSAYRVYVVNASGAAGQTVLLSAALTRHGGIGLAGATITFSVDGTAVGSAVTGKNGIAGFHYTLPTGLSLGGHTITASFAGDGTNPASSGAGTLTVTAARRPNTVVTVGVRSGKAGTTVVLKATLKTPTGGTLSGRTLTYTVNGVSIGSAVTDATGLASLTYTIPASTPAGVEPIVVSFAGDSEDASSSGKGTLTVK